MKQVVLSSVEFLEEALREQNAEKLLIVCDSAYPFLSVYEQIESLPEAHVKFSDFQPNPQYDSVVKGVKAFRHNHCDSILAIGGGSAIDVAKCIKLYAHMDPEQNYLQQSITPNDIPLIAIPTTAGTGSEATRYAVIYYGGEKQSITHESIVPGIVVLDANILRTLPDYQRKATMLDALCHSIEARWSLNSNEESLRYSQQAVRDVIRYKDDYLANVDCGNAGMLMASHLAGKAINITQTTAGHAMCYKITSLYGIAHGHAAALCIAKLWPYMLAHMDACIDPRGTEHLQMVFESLAQDFGCKETSEAPRKFQSILNSLELNSPKAQENDFEVLTPSVNLVRLKNNPIRLNANDIEELYRQILD